MVSPARTISPSKFENTVYKRFKKCEKNRQKMITKLRKEQKDTLLEKKWSSRYKWSEEVQNIEPIHKRMDDVLWRKEQWLRVEQKRKRDQENRLEAKECKFKPNLGLTEGFNNKYFGGKRRGSFKSRSSRNGEKEKNFEKNENFRNLPKNEKFAKNENFEKNDIFENFGGGGKENFFSLKKEKKPRKKSLSLKRIRSSCERLYNDHRIKQERLSSIREAQRKRLFTPRVDEIKEIEMRKIRDKRQKSHSNQKRKNENFKRKKSLRKNFFVNEIHEIQPEKNDLIINNEIEEPEYKIFIHEESEEKSKFDILKDGNRIDERETYEQIFKELEKEEKKNFEKIKRKNSLRKLKKSGKSSTRRSRNSLGKIKVGERENSKRRNKKLEKKIPISRRSNSRRNSVNSKKMRKNSQKILKKKNEKIKKSGNLKNLKKKKILKNSKKLKKKEQLKAKLKALDEKIKQYEEINKQILVVEEGIKECDRSLSQQADKRNSKNLTSFSKSSEKKNSEIFEKLSEKSKNSKISKNSKKSKKLSHSKSKKNLLINIPYSDRRSNQSIGSATDSLEKLKILPKNSKIQKKNFLQKSKNSLKNKKSKKNSQKNLQSSRSRKRQKSKSMRAPSTNSNNKTLIKKPPQNPFYLDKDNYKIINLSNSAKNSLKKNESEPLILYTPLKNTKISNEALRMINVSSDIDPEFGTFGGEKYR